FSRDWSSDVCSSDLTPPARRRCVAGEGGSAPTMNSGLRRVRADNPSPMTLDGTYTYLVGRRRPVVIDPGPPLESHVRRVLDLLAGETPLAIVLTHAHADHSGAAEALARATGAPVWLGAGAHGGASRLPRIDRLVGRGDHLETDVGILEI